MLYLPITWLRLRHRLKLRARTQPLTSIQAMDMADLFPMASVLGIDLSPIQPAFVPPNCAFEVDDLTMEWTFPDDEFDFIHIRESGSD